jgi:hypothetical protein
LLAAHQVWKHLAVMSTPSGVGLATMLAAALALRTQAGTRWQ